MRIRRVNPRGLTFYLDTVCEDRNTTKVQLSGTNKIITFEFPIERLLQSWFDWQIKGKFIQEAFNYLNSDQREFIHTGLTPKEWNKIFPPEKE